MDLSIIIPAYEESHKIRKDIILADNFLNENKFSGEIIVVDDGSMDDTFNSAAGCRINPENKLTVLRNESNLGKGGAVRRGILNSKGNFVMYHDAGVTVPISNALTGLALLKNNSCDIAIGSRKMPGSGIKKGQKLDRVVISKVFGFSMRILFGQLKQFSDTQCGFKIYKGDPARELYSESAVDGFIFEIEILLLALKKKYVVIEFPVEWRCDRDSRISLFRSPWRVLADLIKIKGIGL